MLSIIGLGSIHIGPRRKRNVGKRTIEKLNKDLGDGLWTTLSVAYVNKSYNTLLIKPRGFIKQIPGVLRAIDNNHYSLNELVILHHKQGLHKGKINIVQGYKGDFEDSALHTCFKAMERQFPNLNPIRIEIGVGPPLSDIRTLVNYSQIPYKKILKEVKLLMNHQGLLIA